jgi:hypothetical protein
MAFIYCVDDSGYCLSLSRLSGDPLIEVMIFDQINHKTREVSAELHQDKLLVSLSRSAAAMLDGITEYVVPLALSHGELLEIDAVLQTIFSGVGIYARQV